MAMERRLVVILMGVLAAGCTEEDAGSMELPVPPGKADSNAAALCVECGPEACPVSDLDGNPAASGPRSAGTTLWALQNDDTIWLNDQEWSPASHWLPSEACEPPADGGFGGIPDATSFPAGGRVIVEDVRLGCEGELFEGDQSWCGSVLVTPTVSLTAAHCLQSLVDKGSSVKSIELQGQQYAVSEWSLDPTYGGAHRGTQNHSGDLRPLASPDRGVPKVEQLSPSLDPPTITSRLAQAGAGSDVAVLIHERVTDIAPSSIYTEEADGPHAEGFIIGEEFTLISYGPSHRTTGSGLRRDVRHRASVAANPAGPGGGHTNTLISRDFSFYSGKRPLPDTSVAKDKVQYAFLSAVAGAETPGYLACKGDSGSPVFAGITGASSVVGVMHGFSTAAAANTSLTTKVEDSTAGCTVCNPAFALASLGSTGARTFVCSVLTDQERASLQSTTPGYCAGS